MVRSLRAGYPTYRIKLVDVTVIAHSGGFYEKPLLTERFFRVWLPFKMGIRIGFGRDTRFTGSCGSAGFRASRQRDCRDGSVFDCIGGEHRVYPQRNAFRLQSNSLALIVVQPGDGF